MYGNEIKNARLAIGATQMQVAKATGLPQNTISWIELDKNAMKQLKRIYEQTISISNEQNKKP